MERVQLFATCLGDLLFPDAAADAELLLRDAGFEVEFPAAQVCCGQPAFNSGHRGAARRVARTFAKAFSREAPIVCPSGSCATMASHYLPELLGVEPFDVWELSAFLDDRGASSAARTRASGSPTTTPATCCASCGSRTRRAACSSALAPSSSRLPRPDLCCGFGGTFSVRQPEVSLAMADDKLAGAAQADALVTADPGCLMHLRGRSEHERRGVRVVHLATALARGIDA